MHDKMIKLGGGTITILSDDFKVIDGGCKPFTTPDNFGVWFLFWTPWREGDYNILGGRTVGLQYTVSFDDDVPSTKESHWQHGLEYNEAVDDDIKSWYLSNFNQYALDLAKEARQRKLFEHVVCTNEELKINNFMGDEDIGDKARLRRQFLDFVITPDFKTFENNSMFRYFIVEDGVENSILPNKETIDQFIYSPHTQGTRRKYCYFPSTDYEKMHRWLQCYGFDKPIALETPVPEFVRNNVRICEADNHNKLMDYDEFVKACEEHPHDYKLRGIRDNIRRFKRYKQEYSEKS